MVNVNSWYCGILFEWILMMVNGNFPRCYRICSWDITLLSSWENLPRTAEVYQTRSVYHYFTRKLLASIIFWDCQNPVLWYLANWVSPLEYSRFNMIQPFADFFWDDTKKCGYIARPMNFSICLIVFFLKNHILALLKRIANTIPPAIFTKVYLRGRKI